jgi:hypothetical protein
MRAMNWITAELTELRLASTDYSKTVIAAEGFILCVLTTIHHTTKLPLASEFWPDDRGDDPPDIVLNYDMSYLFYSVENW